MDLWNESSSSCFQSLLPSKLTWVWASMNPGSSVASPRSTTSAPSGIFASAPTAWIFPPEMTSTPGETMRSALESKRRAAFSTTGLGGSAAKTLSDSNVAKQARGVRMGAL